MSFDRAPAAAAAFLAPAFAGLVLFRIAPIALAAVGSLHGTTLLGETRFVGLDNYARLLGDPGFWHSLGVTLLFNLLVNPILLILSFALALLVFQPGWFVNVYRSVFFLPMTMSTALAAVLWNLLLDPNLGPINTLIAGLGFGRQPFFRDASQALPSLVWLAAWKGAGYWMLFMLAGLYAIPGELYEAARVDGASWVQRLRHITLPLMKRAFAFVLVAATAVNFLFFSPVYIITSGGPDGATDLLSFKAYELAFTLFDVGRSLAISTILLVLISFFAALEMKLFEGEE